MIVRDIRRVVAVLAVVTGCLGAVGAPTQAAVGPGVDFNADGIADTVVGERLSWHSGGAGGGTWHQVTDRGFRSMTVCDLNGDGFDDLVAGVPDQFDDGDDGDEERYLGFLYIFMGSPSGLSDGRYLDQNSPGVVGVDENWDRFGASLACGRIGPDQFDDVVVGVPGESLGDWPTEAFGAGAVVVIPGSAAGATGAGSWAISQRTAGVEGTAEDGDKFGSQVAVGDVTGDGFDDIVVAVPGENSNTGAVQTILGSASGWTADGGTLVTGGQVGGWTELGRTLSLGSFDDRPGRDVVVGAQAGKGGGVGVFPSGPTGPNAATFAGFTQASPGVPGADETGDRWGAALAAGDIDGDGRDDLFIGAPGEDVGIIPSAGAVWIMRGGEGGVTTQGAATLSQSTAGVLGASETEDAFGAALSMADLTADGRADLLIGVPGDSVADPSPGRVVVVPAVGTGLSLIASFDLTSLDLGLPASGWAAGAVLLDSSRSSG